MPYFDTNDLIARLGDERFLRLFDRDGDGVADAAALTSVSEYSEAMINAQLNGSFATPLAAPVPVFIRDLAVDLALGRAGEAFPGAQVNGASPYGALHKSALDRLKMLRNDNGARLPAPLGIAEPHASVEAGIVVAEEPTFSGSGFGF